MLTEDYFMRMISQVIAVLMQALGLKKAGRLNESLQVFDQAVETLLGLRADLVKQLDDHQVLDMLTLQGKLDFERLLVLADIYREQGEVYAMQGNLEQSQFTMQRSLRLYLEAFLAGETDPSIELVNKIEALRSSLSPSELPVETRLALLDYLDRLLATHEDFLSAAELTRSDLQAALSSLDSPDLQSKFPGS